MNTPKEFTIIEYQHGGNCALEFIEHATGKTCHCITTGGPSNIRGAFYHLNGGEHKPNYLYHLHEVKAREWKEITKGWPLGKCRSDDIAAWIKQQIAAQE